MTSSSAAQGPRLLRRDRERRWLAGVCAGIARHLGADPLFVRLGFVVATAAGGLGFALYVLAWLLVPVGESTGTARRRLPTGRGAVEVALGTGLLLLSVLLAFRGVGLWFSDAVVWPLVLVATGAALLWRQSVTGAGDVPAAAAPVEALRAPERPPAASPVAAQSAHAIARETAQRLGSASRTAVGIALVIAAGVAFLQATGAFGPVRDVLFGVFTAVVVLGVILAPWIVRLVRSLSAERSQRIRSEERAEMAAHLHDSVLQTLAMVQRRSEHPQEVASLARRQERELRAWLSDRPVPGSAARLEAALEAAAAEVEGAQGVPVEVITVGDRELDPGVEAVVAATREAMLNAAKFGGGSTVDVYAEAANGRLQVFVRDRGPGFDPDAIPADRRGVRESIVGRMERPGGRATITSAPGAGTEVELVLEESSR
ncbi:MAG TPA: PspC domain-containing protein [Thermoleophilaceae bacterium]|nr:PspC domain-containing protein [Thermoleophilaceae bacterium]